MLPPNCSDKNKFLNWKLYLNFRQYSFDTLYGWSVSVSVSVSAAMTAADLDKPGVLLRRLHQCQGVVLQVEEEAAPGQGALAGGQGGVVDEVEGWRVERPAVALALLLTTLHLLLVETIEGKDLEHVRLAMVLLDLLVPVDPVWPALAWSRGRPLAPPQPLILRPG